MTRASFSPSMALPSACCPQIVCIFKKTHTHKFTRNKSNSSLDLSDHPAHWEPLRNTFTIGQEVRDILVLRKAKFEHKLVRWLITQKPNFLTFPLRRPSRSNPFWFKLPRKASYLLALRMSNLALDLLYFLTPTDSFYRIAYFSFNKRVISQVLLTTAVLLASWANLLDSRTWGYAKLILDQSQSNNFSIRAWWTILWMTRVPCIKWASLS